MTRAAIIGSGKVAEAMARVLPAAGIEVVCICARNAERGAALAEIAGCRYVGESEPLPEADICMAAVSDKAISEVLTRIPLPESVIAMHISGATPIEAVPERFRHRGVLYPLQTFTEGREVDFRRVPIFIEASDPQTLDVLRRIAVAIGSEELVFEADSRQRAVIHLAGVFACNFATAMVCAGHDIMKSVGRSGDLLMPIFAETVAKLADPHNSDPRSVLTGPAVRNDLGTMERHRRILADSDCDVLGRIYDSASEYIVKYGKKL